MSFTIKPIFYCDAKTLALGPGVGDTNMLVSKNAKICVTPNANSKICVTPNANLQLESVEYRWRWVFWRWYSRWPCIFHVVCASFSALATRKLADAKSDSSGIQASETGNLQLEQTIPGVLAKFPNSLCFP